LKMSKVAFTACALAGVSTSQAFIAPNAFTGRSATLAPRMASINTISMISKEEYAAKLKECAPVLTDMLDKTNSAPIMVRLAWHDSGTFDKDAKPVFPECGGANGSIRFDPEITHGANAGLSMALKLLEPIHKQFPEITWADLMQMASALGIENAGGPKIPMKYGRVDATGPEDCPKEGNLPGAAAPFDDGSKTPQEHLRKVFYRMGFNDQEIVALSGAHTLGRAWKDRSGMGAEKTKYTSKDHVARADGKPGIGKEGGSSWTEKWLKFDNSYYQTVPDADADPELLKLETDKSLFDDEGFLPTAQKYKNDEAAFFEEYAAAHVKLSELGSQWMFDEPVTV
jgi:L-ascorbate peroxidase